MTPAITVLTLGVDDLARAVAFYRDGLGFPTQGIVGTEFENGAVAFFNLQSGLKLALWPRRSLGADLGRTPATGARDPLGLSIGHNVASPDEVDAVMRQAARAGAAIVKPAQPTFYGGYAGYFEDPDGHLWEVAHNPASPNWVEPRFKPKRPAAPVDAAQAAINLVAKRAWQARRMLSPPRGRRAAAPS